MVIAVACSHPAMAATEIVTWRLGDGIGNDLKQEFTQWIDGEGLQLALLPADKNIAIGEISRDDFGLRVPLTDGEVALVASEWISNTPNVFGRFFTVDLGRNRAITRVRVRPGQTALNQPEYFVRGYRIEAAKENDSDIWRLLAEQRTNFILEIDTATDSTWIVIDEKGHDISRQGRHLRFTITRQDRSNWVALGDIEVFAEGFEVEATVEEEWSTTGPVNIGRIRWQAELADKTAFQLSARDGAAVKDWMEVRPQENGALFSASEPIDLLQMRAVMSTRDPFASPLWRQLEVEYDRRLIASRVVGAVRPNTVTKGEEATITYTLALDISAADYGVDLVQLDGVALKVDEVVVDGATLGLGADYTFSSNIEKAETQITFINGASVQRNAIVEISGKALFLKEVTTIRPKVGNSAQGLADNYINWQNGEEDTFSSWSVRTIGDPGQLLSRIEAPVRSFSPYPDGEIEFSFVVGNLTNPTDVTLSIYSLDGNRVQRLVQNGGARAYQMSWDGRDESGRVVDPGLYLYEVRVEGGGDPGGRRGTCVVAY
ncbi:MAG: FlgD immunoglobulin-like domain containing protein [Candidatus Latescibacterota bacterium]